MIMGVLAHAGRRLNRTRLTRNRQIVDEQVFARCLWVYYSDVSIGGEGIYVPPVFPRVEPFDELDFEFVVFHELRDG